MNNDCFANTTLGCLGNARVTELRQVGRYSMYNMWYRIDLYQHTKQLCILVEAVLPFLGDYLLDDNLVRLYAAIHDDPEIFPGLGDVQAAYKAVMEPREVEALEALEERAVAYVIEQFGDVPLLDTWTYSQILLNYRRQLGPEAQLVHYLDKVGAFYEAMHELMAGNPEIITNKPDPKGRMTKHPIEGYPTTTARLVALRPFLREIAAIAKAPFLRPIAALPYLTLFKQGQPHTLESVRERAALDPETRNTGYSTWLKTILESGDDELIEALHVPNTRHFPNCP